MTSTESTTVAVGNPLGMHLRVAGKLAQLATGFSADITLTCGTVEANAKSIMSVLSLAASHGAVLKVWASGSDATEAVKELCALISDVGGEAPAGRG